MTERFFFWTIDPIRGVRLKSVHESWPITLEEPCDEESGFARDYAMQWRDDPDFPDHPIRDKSGHVILPDSIDQHPTEYVEANTPAVAAETESYPAYPFSGPANLTRGPGANSSSTIAAYERTRRGLGKSMLVKPAPEPYEPPTTPAGSHTPNTPAGPEIAPRFYSRHKFDPKYRRPGDAA